MAPNAASPSAVPPPPEPPPLPAAAGHFAHPEPAPTAKAETFYQGPGLGDPSLPSPGGAQLPPPPKGTLFGAHIAQLRIYRPLRTGEFLKETFSIYFSSFFSFVLLTAIAMAPAFLLTAYAEANPDPQMMGLGVGAGGLLSLFFCQPLSTAAITYGVFQQMRGADASIGSCLRIGLASLFPVLAVAIVQGCALMLGALLLCIGYFIFMARYSVAIPVALEERPGAFEALRRSGDLTDGYRWPIFFTLAAISLVGFGLVFATIVLMRLAEASTQAQTLAQNGITVLTVGLSATASSVIYYRLRCVKESLDVDQISSVFD